MLPRTNGFSPSFGVYLATISGFITNPPAAMMTDFALIAPVSEKCFHVTPVTAPESSTMSSVAPVSYRICTPRLAARLSSRSITMLAPPVSPGTGTLWPRGAGTACSRKGHTFSLPVNIKPSVFGWITALPGK